MALFALRAVMLLLALVGAGGARADDVAVPVAAVVAAPVVAAPAPPRGEDLVILLVTFGPGDDVTSWFGHSALVVEDRKTQEGRLYNYGEFGFDATTVARYALGRLEFWVGERPVEATFEVYRRQRRTIDAQELALSPAQRAELAAFLHNNALPENRRYLYDHFTDNCATRPRDAVDVVAAGALAAAGAAPGRMTLRQHVRRHTDRSLVMSTLIDLVLNRSVDAPTTRAQEAFLPAELHKLVVDARVGGASLQLRGWRDFDAPARAPVPAEPPRNEPWMLAVGVVVAVVSLLLRRFTRVFALWLAGLGLFVGLPGVVLVIIWSSTDHLVAHNNENVLLANPLALLSFPLGVAWALGIERAGGWLRRVWAVVAVVVVGAVVLKALPWFGQDNWNIVALVVPLALGTALALRRSAARPVESVS